MIVDKLDFTRYFGDVNDESGGRAMLTTPLFDVNLTLFHDNPDYKRLIVSICDYMSFVCVMDKGSECKESHSVSGGLLSIPFNIIVIKDKDNKAMWKPYKNTKETICLINPRITGFGGNSVTAKTYCGGLRKLKDPVSVSRMEKIDLSFYNVSGEKRYLININEDNYGMIIQHSIDHNKGILVTHKANHE